MTDLIELFCFFKAPPRAILTKKYEDGLIFEDGDMIRLKVEFNGRPKPEVSWYHENQLMTSGGRLEIEVSSDCTILKVAQAKRSDRGEYTVKLQSGLGEDSASFLVTIASKFQLQLIKRIANGLIHRPLLLNRSTFCAGKTSGGRRDGIGRRSTVGRM